MKIDRLEVSSFTVPTEAPESDGTLRWDRTTLVLVETTAGGETGIGYTYAHRAAATLIRDKLAELITERDPLDIPAAWQAMRREVRNLGACGIAAMAISAVDHSLWDLKARLLGLPLVKLLGACRGGMPIYGSGGFTSYDDEQLARQLGGWVDAGISRVKMKVGREPERDPERVRVARQAIGDDAELFVDANSAYDRKQALHFMHWFAGESDVRWIEQPLPPEDRCGMRFLRRHSPPELEITDGEYAWGPADIREMIDADEVDVVMADATRCGGVSGFMKIAALCEAHRLPLSAHCAPLLHLHPGCAAAPLRHAEYFHDHVRIERLFFDGFPDPVDGALHPDPSTPGLGVTFKTADAEPYRDNP
ncbi:enolase C-terminal domain-like protein [Haloferula sargassicola]|uniref:L-talarate/galactarate dehydratase n=1 Tax=Haloferula sargassicola TaxID=490096 RepID=A0ABP9UKP8_9BACT